MHKREVVEAVTVIETPPMVIVGVVGYVETPRGLRSLTTVWAEHLSDEVKRRFYKSWYRSKKKAFTKYAKKHAESGPKSTIARELERVSKYCTVVRVLAHTQIRKTGLEQKKAHLMEIQVNGGSVADKVEFAKSHFEKTVDVHSIFEQDENIDIIGVTTGHGFEGVTHRSVTLFPYRAILPLTLSPRYDRWGTKKLPRKTHKVRSSPFARFDRMLTRFVLLRVSERSPVLERGILRRSCTLLPELDRTDTTTEPSQSRFSFSHSPSFDHFLASYRSAYRMLTIVLRRLNKKVYRLGKADDASSASTEFDTTVKTITPMGGFVRYGIIKNDFVVIKGAFRPFLHFCSSLLELLLTACCAHRMLPRNEEESRHPPKVAPQPHFAKSFGEDQPQVHRYFVSRALLLPSHSPPSPHSSPGPTFHLRPKKYSSSFLFSLFELSSDCFYTSAAPSLGTDDS